MFGIGAFFVARLGYVPDPEPERGTLSASFDLLRKLGKLRHLDIERRRDSSDGAPSRVAAALDMRDPGRMQVCAMGNFFLGEAASGPDLADCLTEGDLGIGAWSHAPHPSGRSRSRP